MSHDEQLRLAGVYTGQSCGTSPRRRTASVRSAVGWDKRGSASKIDSDAPPQKARLQEAAIRQRRRIERTHRPRPRLRPPRSADRSSPSTSTSTRPSARTTASPSMPARGPTRSFSQCPTTCASPPPRNASRFPPPQSSARRRNKRPLRRFILMLHQDSRRSRGCSRWPGSGTSPPTDAKRAGCQEGRCQQREGRGFGGGARNKDWGRQTIK
jgi:hypothetical protein